MFTGRNDPFARRVSVAGPTHELDILAETVVRGPRTVPHEIRMEWNRNDSGFVADNNQLESRRYLLSIYVDVDSHFTGRKGESVQISSREQNSYPKRPFYLHVIPRTV